MFGVTITVTDATTGQPIREGISGRLQEGSYSEDMEHFDNRLLGAGERAGTYTATVNGTGYEQWTESGIVVTADECHVRPVALEARLTPSG